MSAEQEPMADDVKSDVAASTTPPSGDAAATEKMINIKISDPIKQGEGMNAFVSYKITTKTNLPQYEYGHFSVIRRYSDFVWLHSQLIKHFPGIIIPPLPEKLVVGRFSEEFVESRRRALEKFLQRVAGHSLLCDSEHFKCFLESSEESFSAMKEHTKTSVMSKGFWQWASEASHTISTKLGSTPDRPKTEADFKFDEVAAYVNGLEPQMTSVHKHTQGLIRRSKEMANGLFEFGLAFTLLGQSESDSLGAGLAALGHTADRLSVLAAEEAEKEALYFEEPIKDYIRIIGAVRQALDARNEKLLTYETAMAELETRQQTAARVNSIPGKQALAEAEVQKAKQRVEECKEVFEVVTSRVLQEVERFKREKLLDFKSIVLDYVQLQIEHNQKTEEAWRAVLPELQAVDVSQALQAPSLQSSASSLQSSVLPPKEPKSQMEQDDLLV